MDQKPNPNWPNQRRALIGSCSWFMLLGERKKECGELTPTLKCLSPKVIHTALPRTAHWPQRVAQFCTEEIDFCAMPRKVGVSARRLLHTRHTCTALPQAKM